MIRLDLHSVIKWLLYVNTAAQSTYWEGLWGYLQGKKDERHEPTEPDLV